MLIGKIPYFFCLNIIDKIYIITLLYNLILIGMKKKILFFTYTILILFTISNQSLAQTICNPSGNLLIYSNYDGGALTINVDVNIPNIKIGVVSYGATGVTITGPFASNVTQVVYAGTNDNGDACNTGILTTTFSGVSPTITSININPSVGSYTPAHGNGDPVISCGIDCDTLTGQGGCNTPDEIVYYFTQLTGGTLRYHYIDYNCWASNAYSVSAGGNCCIVPLNCPGPLPPTNITPTVNLSLCGSGSSATLLASAPGTINWFSSPTSTTSIASGSAFVTPTLNVGNYTYYANTTNTCTSSSRTSFQISVKALPNVLLASSGNSVCSGQPINLFASGATSYLWNTSQTTNSISVTPTVTASYSVTGTNTANCSFSKTITIVVTPSPIAPTVLSTPLSLCQPGGTINLNATAGSSLSVRWYTVPIGGNLLGTSISGSNFNTNAVTTTTYYAEAISSTPTLSKLNFNFTGTVQTHVIPSGVSSVTLQTWGAQGGGSSLSGNTSSGTGGKGGYAYGTLTVTPGSTLNIYTGGAGLSSTLGLAAGGWNGGGQGYGSSNSEPGNGGGGASDIRLNGNALSNRIIIGGGGGGGGEDAGDLVGNGGGLTGAGYAAYDATQTTAGSGGSLGFGGGTGNGDGGGGGGGLYGGGTFSTTTVGQDTQGGGGGSGFIGGVQNGTLIAGNAVMPDPFGTGTIIGKTQNGVVSITQSGNVN